MSLFFSKVLRVQYKVALSAFSNFCSNSDKLIAVFVQLKLAKPTHALRLA